MSEPNQTFPLVAFDPSEAHIQAYRGEIAATVAEAADFNLAAAAMQLAPDVIVRFRAPKRELVRLRNQIDNGRKAMNADALAYQRSVNSAAAKYIGLMTQDEDILTSAIEKHERAERALAEAKVQAREAQEAAEAKRIADELAAIKHAERMREEAERAAERMKLAEERAAFEKLQREERKEEAERRAAEDAERTKEKAAIEAQAAKIREEQEKLDRTKREVELREAAEAKADERAKAMFEQRKIEEARQAQEKTDREKAAAIRAEADRIEAEKRAAEEKRAEEAARPDVQKIRSFGERLQVFLADYQPDLTTRAAQLFLAPICSGIQQTSERCSNFGKKPGKAKVQA